MEAQYENQLAILRENLARATNPIMRATIQMSINQVTASYEAWKANNEAQKAKQDETIEAIGIIVDPADKEKKKQEQELSKRWEDLLREQEAERERRRKNGENVCNTGDVWEDSKCNFIYGFTLPIKSALDLFNEALKKTTDNVLSNPYVLVGGALVVLVVLKR